MENKLLTVIIPAYNVEEYIKECLYSLRGLLSDEVEIIVINDGSNDRTADIVRACNGKDKRIRLINLENGGVSRARNKGIEEASGKYLMFLDADDYLKNDAFGLIKDVIYNKDSDFTAFARDILETNGKIWKQGFPFELEELKKKKSVDLIMYTDSLFNECWGKLYKKEIIEKNNLRFPENVAVGEDLMFVMSYYSLCDSVNVYNTSLVVYRQRLGSAMKKYDIRHRMKMTEDIYKFSKKFLPEDLMIENAFYNFRVLTNLCRNYSVSIIDKDLIKCIYSSEMKTDILSKLKACNIPITRKHEYFLMKLNLFFLSAVYYHIKAKLAKM